MGSTHFPNHYISEAVSPGEKELKPADGRPPTSDAKAKDAKILVSSPPYIVMGWCLIKHRGNCVFTLESCQYLPNLLLPSHEYFMFCKSMSSSSNSVVDYQIIIEVCTKLSCVFLFLYRYSCIIVSIVISLSP